MTDTDIKQALTGLGDAARAIGEDDFYRRLLDALSSLVNWDCRAVARYSMTAPPVYLFEEGADPEVIDLYLRGYYRVDPYYAAFRKNEDVGLMVLDRDLRLHDANPYIMIFAPTAKWRDEIGILLPASDGTAVGLFWETLDRVFDAVEIDAMESVHPLVRGLCAAHGQRRRERRSAGGPELEVDASPPPGPVSLEVAVETFLDGDHCQMTPREREIVALSLAGKSNAEISEDLGIEIGSVKNHRGRLYKKLGIAGERDLFRMFLDHLAGMADG